MSRSLLKTLLALAALVAVLGLGACGGGDDDESGDTGGTPAQSAGGGDANVTEELFKGTATDNLADPTEGGKKGGKFTILSSGDVDYMDPGKTYYSYGSDGSERDQPRSVRLHARRHVQARAGPRRGRPGDLRGRQDRHREDQEGRDVLQAGQPRGHLEGRQVRDRARVHSRTSPTVTPASTCATSSALRRSRAPTRRSRASRRPTTRRSCSSSPRARAPALAGALCDADLRSRSRRSTRRSTTRRTRRPTARAMPSTPARTWSRATPRARPSATSPARASTSCATRITRTWTTSVPRSSTRSTSWRATTTTRWRRAGSSSGESMGTGDIEPPASQLKRLLQSNKTELSAVPGGGWRMISLDTSAARRSTTSTSARP